ncbi:cyclase-like protein 1 isoform X2 [Miscanthus floridulus]|uniref:cyclase-like protein 1 isoform X2 n=2 Tax=Miscanthus floridulus TaxID=154761 RepID=UPI003459B8A9
MLKEIKNRLMLKETPRDQASQKAVASKQLSCRNIIAQLALIFLSSGLLDCVAPSPSGRLDCELVAMSASPLMAMLLLASTVAPRVPVARGSGMSAAHPAYADATAYGPAAASAVEAGLEEYGGGRIVDITHAYRPELPFPGRDGLGAVTRLTESMANGSVNNVSELRMVVHSGTHVDAPGHMVQEHFEAGLGVDKLDLDVLNGPALLIDVPRHTNITAQAMESLNITKGIRRVLFRTLNTDRKLMWTKEIDTSFVGFTEDGAQWLVDNTDIKLVGHNTNRRSQTRPCKDWSIYVALLTSQTYWM